MDHLLCTDDANQKCFFPRWECGIPHINPSMNIWVFKFSSDHLNLPTFTYLVVPFLWREVCLAYFNPNSILFLCVGLTDVYFQHLQVDSLLSIYSVGTRTSREVESNEFIYLPSGLLVYVTEMQRNLIK